ncbi:MAG: hypothetical protein HDR88_03010 [Bacteroides sp.]|nr:hypothetical protein [Bacteroides sp.]
MLDFGFIILIIGLTMLIWQKLSARSAMKALTPRSVFLRTSAEENIRYVRKRGSIEAYVIIILGAFIILFTGVMN